MGKGKGRGCVRGQAGIPTVRTNQRTWTGREAEGQGQPLARAIKASKEEEEERPRRRRGKKKKARRQQEEEEEEERREEGLVFRSLVGAAALRPLGPTVLKRRVLAVRSVYVSEGDDGRGNSGG